MNQHSACAARPRILALFPGALGDLLCCWPALDSWRRHTGAALTLAARDAWFDALPHDDDLAALSIDRREVADLFGSAPLAAATRTLFNGFTRVASWTGYGDANFARRLADATGTAAVAVHPFRALRRGEHAAQYYARCLGVDAVGCSLPVRAAAAQWVDRLWNAAGLDERTLVIHAGSGSAGKNWEGMSAVGAGWRADGGQVIVLRGPAEHENAAAIAHDIDVDNEPLDRVAALLARTSRYLGNDSGISHLAGQVGARGIAVFGSSDPIAWRPLGDGVRVIHAPDACAQCGRDRFCVHRLSPDDVLAALRRA